MMSKHIIIWNPDLATGLKQVDEEHQGLVALINEVAPLLIGSPDDLIQDFDSIHQRLMEYADTHFKTEESLMHQYQVDARSRDRHHRIHEGFIAQVAGMKHRAAGRENIHAEDLLSFLAGWLIHHVLGEDQSMARQIHAIHGGMTPEQAYREAGGYRTAPSEEALTRLLTHLYKRLIHAQKSCPAPPDDRPADPSNT
jgi:hemerythrin-like metal-binding protein